MKFGSSNVSSFRVGSATPSKIYLGAVEVWSDAPAPRTLYWNNEENDFGVDWSDLNNWWADAEFSVQATSLPTSSDTVVLVDAYIEENSGPAPTVAAINASGDGDLFFGMTVTVLGVAEFAGAVLLSGTLAGNVTFNASSINAGTITGDATFNDYSSNYGTVTGDATFNFLSSNEATVTENATFNDNTSNGNTVTGNATFNDSSYNTSAVGGNATFNDSSYNAGFVNGTATFTGSACNADGTAGTFVPDPPPACSSVPGEVQNLSAVISESEQNAADLTWSVPLDDGGGVDTYNIYWSTDNVNFELLDSVSGSTFAFTAISTIAGLGYSTAYFQVTAVNAAGEGPAVSASSVLSDSVPEPPQNVTATQLAGGVLSISWDLSGRQGTANGNTSYEIQWDYGANDWITQTTTTYSNNQITVALDQPAVYIRVRAINSVGNSEWSATITSVGADVPAQITTLQVDYNAGWAEGDSDLVAYFSVPSNNGSEITGYTIEWSLDQNMGEIVGSDTWAYSNEMSGSGLYRPLFATFIGGYTYYFRAYATNALGNGVASHPPATATAPATVPLAPDYAQITLSPNYSNDWFDVTWVEPHDGGSSISAYDVEWRDEANQATTYTINVNNNSPYVYISVNGGQSISVRVRAINSVGTGEWSDWSAPGFFAAAPEDPSNLSISDEELGEVFLDWDAPGNTAAMGPSFIYKIAYGPTGGGEENNTIDNISGASSSYLISGLTPGVEYQFRVYTGVPGRGNNNETQYSNYIYANHTPAVGVPDAPTVNAATWNGNTQTLAISYNAPNDNGGAIIEYYVYFDGSFAYSAADPATVYDATNRIGAYVSISAVNSGGEGMQSQQAQVTDGIVARSLYFSGTTNADWSTLGNWYDDSGHTIAASSLPTSIDSVTVSASITSNSGSAPTVVNFTMTSGSFENITIAVTGVAAFSNSAINYSAITGNATFYDSSINGGTITGNSDFYATSSNDGTVTGNATFYDSSYNNAGTVTGDATFTASSFPAGNPQQGTVTGTVSFPNYPNAFGCADSAASNYNPDALIDDGSCTYPPSYTPTAVLLTTGSSYTVPEGATSVKAWAVGSGGVSSGSSGSLAGGGRAGGCAYITWVVTGGDTISYALGAAQSRFERAHGQNTTVTFAGTTITGNGGGRFAVGSFSGGDGGANGGNNGGSWGYYGASGGAVGGNGARAACGRVQATDVDGLFAALALAGASTDETCDATAAFGSGGADQKYGPTASAGFGGGGVLESGTIGMAGTASGGGAVVLYFT